MTPVPSPKVFISYSWADSEMHELAERLNSSGVDVWLDKWEIRAGDSLVERVGEGLSNYDAYIIGISEHSINSKWVQEELNTAIHRRIVEQRRLIPVRIDNTPLPPIIAHLNWVRLQPMGEAVEKLLKSIFGLYDKPPAGQVPEYIREGLARKQAALSGLTPNASAALRWLVSANKDEEFLFWLDRDVCDLEKMLGLDETDVDDAVDELEERSLAQVTWEGGYRSLIRPMPRAWLYVDHDTLGYDIVYVMRVVAPSIVHHSRIDGATLLGETNLPIEQLRAAVFVLEAEGVIAIDCAGIGGGRPFGFLQAIATHRTRSWVRDNCS